MKKHLIRDTSLIFVVMLFTACGGGGGGDTDTLPPSNNGVDTINSELSGRLYYQDYRQYVYLIDAATGMAEYIHNTDWINQREQFPSGVTMFYSYPRPNNNTEFLVTAAHCKHVNSDPLSAQLSCLIIQDYQGNYLSQFDIGDSVSGSAKLSPNGQYIALYRNLNRGGSGQEWFEIYTRDGKLVSDKNEDYKEFHWLNNGQILTAYNRHFIFTEIYSTNDAYYLSLPDELGGESIVGSIRGDFSISHDNTQIAFTLYHNWEDSGKYGDALFIMNIDGTNIRKVAICMNDTYQHIEDLTWSPDGRWIMVKEGYSPSQDDDVLGTSGYLYAIPTENMGKVFQLSIDDSKRSPEVIQFRHDRNLTDPGGVMTFNAFGSSSLVWIP